MRCLEDLNYFVDPGHFHMSYQPVTSFVEPDTLVDPNQCGDLQFDNRTRSFTTTYASGDPPTENPWKMWWRRPRSRQFGTAVSVDSINALALDSGVPHTQYVAMPLNEEYDAIGAVLVMYTDYLDVDEWGEVAFTPPYEGPWPDLNLMVQHWRHIDAPILNSATVNGTSVMLTWTNTRPYLRAIDSTNIYRSPLTSPIGTVGPADTSWVDSNVPPGEYTYTLKHVSPPAAPINPPFPNSASSNPKTVTVAPPPALSVTIGGPDYLWSPGKYQWSASVAAGTPPYAYQWWLDPFLGGPQWQLVSTSWRYTRTVTYQDLGFTLRVDVTDAAQQVASDTLLVFTHWGYGPVTR